MLSPWDSWPGRCGALRRQQEFAGETVTGYLKGVGIAVRPPGGWGQTATGKTGQQPDRCPGPDSKPANEVNTDFGTVSGLPGAAMPQAISRLFQRVRSSRGRNAMAIWQDRSISMASRAGIKASNASSTNCTESTPEACAVTLTKAEETQVD